MMKILVTGHTVGDPKRLTTIEQQHGIKFVVANGDDAVELIKDADAVYGVLSAPVFAHQQRLRWVQSPSAGVEWLWKVPALQESDVVVTNMRGAHAATIAEHTFAMLLAQTRQLFAFEQHQRDHFWGRGDLVPCAIKGLTMGIVGFGNIGRAIARRASAFEMRVQAVDAEPVPPGDGVDRVWPLDRLDELCREADVLVIAAPLTPTSRGMIGAAQLRQMRRGSYLFQMSRGGI